MHHNHDFYSRSIDTDDKLYFVLGVYKNVMYWGNVCMISLIVREEYRPSLVGYYYLGSGG